MARRRTSAFARLAAPIAFLLAATVAILLVRSALHAGEEPAARERPAASETQPGRTTTAPARRRRNANPPAPQAEERSFYRVAPNDTLETIAAAHGTSVEELLELNPGIDPRALTVGQQIRVR